MDDQYRGFYEREVGPVLTEGEELVDAVAGMAEVTRGNSKTRRRGTLFITGRRVGVLSKKIGGHDLTDFAFELLTSVEHKKGLMNGEITLLAPGSNIRVHQISKDQVEPMARLIRDAVTDAHGARHAPVPPPTASAISVADEIAKLGALKSQGLLTEEEFAAEKARLLSH
jgi:hypothetical protein